MTAPSAESSLVLLVDDDPGTRIVISRMLQPLGATVLEASNGQEALDIVREQPVRVVISDLIMPRMSGLMLLHTMLEQGFHLPFVLVTGFGDKDSAIQALRLGAFDYLEKPLHSTDLNPVIEEALRVSQDQQNLFGKLEPLSATSGRHIDPRAEVLIRKMRTFRQESLSTVADLEQSGAKGWQDLKQLFMREAESQLIFTDRTLNSLQQAESVYTELGFILRCVQSVRLASEAIRLSDIADFAWSLETTLDSLKRAGGGPKTDQIALIGEGLGVLKKKIANLDDPADRALQQRLEELRDATYEANGYHAAS